MKLHYLPFANSARICKAVDIPRSWFAYGEKGEGTAILQGALADLGLRLPISTGKAGGPDGIYGNETFAAIKQFQGRTPGLTADGLAGRQTILKLDAALNLKSSPIPPQLKRPTTPRKARYKIGTTGPQNPIDVGAGPWQSKPAENAYIAMHAALLAKIRLGSASMWAITGPNAMRHMRHYLENTGRALTVNLENMIATVLSARMRLRREELQAKVYCQSLPAGSHDIVSECVQWEYNKRSESSDWYFAMGGYQNWGSGKVTVVEPVSGPKSYALDFAYHVFDPYTWDGGKAVDLGGITVTDESLGEFHLQGIARQFNQSGTVNRRLTWTHDDKMSSEGGLNGPLDGGMRDFGRAAAP